MTELEATYYMNTQDLTECKDGDEQKYPDTADGYDFVFVEDHWEIKTS